MSASGLGKIGAVVTRSEASARRAVRFIGAGKACAGMTTRILASRVILIALPMTKLRMLRKIWRASVRHSSLAVLSYTLAAP